MLVPDDPRPLSTFIRDGACHHCGHDSRHVIGKSTGTLYCLECAGECREAIAA